MADGVMRGALAPEFQLICLAARRHFHEADRQAMVDIVRRGVDWRLVLGGIARHRVAFLVKSRLLSSPGLPVPAEVEDTLRRMVRGNAQNALRQIAELDRLTERLARAGVRSMVLKGVPLASDLYGNVAARGVGDIDLLVAPDDFLRANGILAAAGYVSDHGSITAARLAVEMRAGKDWTFRHRDGGSVIELHHQLARSRTVLPIDFEELWQRSTEVNLGQTSVAVLSFPILPLYLCIHGGTHCWDRLQWLIDFERCFGGDRHNEIFTLADQTGNQRLIRHAVALGRRLLGPASFAGCDITAEAELGADRFIRVMLTGDQWLREPQAGGAALRREIQRRLHRLRMRDRWRDVAEELWLELHSSADWDAFRLPERLSWLYFCLRPFGWIVRNLNHRIGDVKNRRATTSRKMD